MKIKELFNMMETSNEVSKYCSNEMVALYFTDNNWCELGNFKSYKAFKEFCKNTYSSRFNKVLFNANFENHGTLSFYCNIDKCDDTTILHCNMSIEFMTIGK